jgi:hypothetical protein
MEVRFSPHARGDSKDETYYVFFLAHAGADTARAKELRDFLEPGIRTFLDACELDPGDQWDVELPKHQRRALATVALLSNKTELAYYLREEIATAIAYERHDSRVHRLIPVWLDGLPANPADVPYGVRVKHALDAARLGMQGVAEELTKIASGLSGDSPPTLPPRMPKPADRIALYDAMCKVPVSMFEEIIFRTDAPVAHLTPSTISLAMRAMNLVQWAEGQDSLQKLTEAVLTVAPGALLRN